MLKLSNVSAGYDGNHVIHDISLYLPKGESLCILGPNSCGKTTLLRTIAGLIPSDGSILLEGREIGGMKRGEIAKKIAVMSQISQVNFPFTVYETVMMSRYQHRKKTLFGKNSSKDLEVVENCLKRTDLLDIRNKEIDCLSGGQIQRVFLAQTLVQEPELILLDEPTNHLDIKHQLELISYLNEWSMEEGHAVIGVLHDINLAMRLSENMLFMKEGRIKGKGHVNELINTPFLEAIYDTDIVGFMVDSFRRWNTFDDIHFLSIKRKA
jgi:iron complex transport system ATP-binding protein